MCGRLTQYRGIHDFVAVLSIPDALINHVGDAPLNRYNAAPTTALAVLHQHEQAIHADNLRWGWRPHWARIVPRPSTHGWKKSPTARSSGRSGGSG